MKRDQVWRLVLPRLEVENLRPRKIISEEERKGCYM
jgi:hypothetical protein